MPSAPLPQLIQWFEQHLGVQPVADAAAAAARDRDAELRAAEELREQQRQARIAELRQRFVDGPVFVMACGGSGTSNSLGAVAIPGAGTVYFNPYRLSGRCGTLAAENGVLVAPDGGSRRLAAPVRGDEVTISGDGWTFKAAAGWVVREGARQGRLRSRPAAAMSGTRLRSPVVLFALVACACSSGSRRLGQPLTLTAAAASRRLASESRIRPWARWRRVGSQFRSAPRLESRSSALDHPPVPPLACRPARISAAHIPRYSPSTTTCGIPSGSSFIGEAWA